MSEQELKIEKPETKEKEPKISYEIFYSAHETAKDMKKLAEIFPNCDIYIPEGIDWTPKILADFQSLSNERTTPQKLKEKYNWSKNSSWTKSAEMIYQSQKPILFADLGKGHKLEETMNRANILYAQSFEEFKDGNFPVALQKMREFITKNAEYRQKREEIIKTNLKTIVQELIKNTPQLKNKEEIKVLLSLGITHTPLFHSLKQEKPLTARQFANLPSIFISHNEASRRMIFSKEVKDELLSKIFIEHFLFDHLRNITDDFDKMARIVRKISSKISLSEIKKLSENWFDDRSRGLPRVLREFFQNKGIKIPENEKEIDETLKSE